MGILHQLARPLDWLAEWLGDHLSPQAQLRIGILSVVGSFPFYALLYSTKEPRAVFLMSALALTLTGIAFVVGAEVLLAQQKQDEEQGEKLDRIIELLERLERKLA